METQYNLQYGARLRHFQVHDHVWARKRKDTPWFEAIITTCCGSRMFDVSDASGKNYRLHTNQLLKRYLLDETHDLDAPLPASNSTSEVSPTTNQPSPPHTPQTSPRRSTRTRKAPTRINIDPKKKSYY
uniref:Uncharacterized protein n=1 Tax=Panagrolaimus superbus TaxID=310955 RepID=A0A914Z069_9BILA